MKPPHAPVPLTAFRAAMSRWADFVGCSVPVAVAVVGVQLGCSRSVTKAEVQYASDFNTLGSTAAVVGVLRGNRLDLEVGDKVANWSPGILGRCPPGFVAGLRAERPGIFEALAQPVGPERDERWVPTLVPAARAAFIVILEIFGNAGSTVARADSEPALVAQSRRRSRRRSDVQKSPVPPGPPDMEMDATFYSVQHRRTVARLEVRYSGDSEREAYQQFGAEFDKAFGQLTCGAWDWSALKAEKKIDSLGLPVPGGQLLPASVAGP